MFEIFIRRPILSGVISVVIVFLGDHPVEAAYFFCFAAPCFRVETAKWQYGNG